MYAWPSKLKGTDPKLNSYRAQLYIHVTSNYKLLMEYVEFHSLTKPPTLATDNFRFYYYPCVHQNQLIWGHS